MDVGFFQVVTSLLLGIISVVLVKWLQQPWTKVIGKFDNLYQEFDHLPRYGTRFTATYKIIAPLFLTNRRLSMNSKLLERLMALCVVANGAPMLRTDFAFTKHLIVLKGTIAKHVLTSKENIEKSSQLYHFVKKWLGNGLITSDQEIWRDRRKKLAPTLHTKIVDSYFEIFYENALTLVSKLDGLTGKTVDIMPILGLCTLDIIVETLTGVKMGIQKNEDSEYVQSINTLTSASMDRIYTPWQWLDCTYKLFPEGKKYFKALKYSRDFTVKVIEERKRSLLESKTLLDREKKYQLENENVDSKLRCISFLDMVLEMHIEDKTFTLQDVLQQTEALLLGGYDTTSISMGFILFLLGLDQSRLGKVHQELDDVLGTNPDTPIEIYQLKNLPYLECVIKESARLYPPVPLIARTLQSDLQIGDLLIPKGTSFDISIHSIHRDPDVYSEPDKFIPERFLHDAIKPFDSYSYLPFSAGPRSCIG